MSRKRRSQEDFEAEIHAHIKLEEERLVESGMPREQARFAARRAFGNRLAAAERFYESGSHFRWRHLRQDLWHDLRFAFRTLRHSPGFAVAAVLTLALGIGANTAMFTVIDAALLKPLPFPNAERLFMIYGRSQTNAHGALSPADFLDYRNQAHSFAYLCAYRETSFNLTGQSRPERVLGAVVTPEIFQALGVQPLAGRPLSPDLDKPGSPPAVVLSRALWRRLYADDPGILGKSIAIDDDPTTVVGVMPDRFQFPTGCEMWVSSPFAVPPHPLNPTKDNSTSRSSHYMSVIGELAPGSTTSQADAEISAIAGRLNEQYGANEEYTGAVAVPLRDDLIGKTRPALLILLAAVALLLLIACANVANIVLARAATRQKEITIRIALGARRLRVIRQLLTESIVLALIGGGLGVLIASAAISPLRTLVPADVIGGTGLELDARVLVFTSVVSFGSAILFGLLPAIHLASPDLNGVLEEGGRGSGTGQRARRARAALIVSEIALATVLLIGAGLLIRSFDRLLATPEGFNAEQVLSLQLSLAQARYPKQNDRAAFVKQSLAGVSALPGVTSAAAISRLPLAPGRSTRSLGILGRTPPPEGDPSPDYLVVSPNYFRSMGIPLISGREFTDRDDTNAPSVGIVSESVARRFWPGQDPIGKFIMIGVQKDWSPIVGVVGDVHQHDLGDPPPLAVYVPYAQDPWPSLSIVVRTQLEPASTSSQVVAAIHSVDKDEPVYNVRTMPEVVAASVSPQRMRMVLLGLFALVAVTLASVGIYGIISYSVEQRTNEIGIRMALGAARSRLLILVVGEGMKLAGAGIAAGLVLSLGFTWLMASLLFGVRSADPVTFAAVSVLLAIVALAASYIPAWRAARTDPIRALRVE